MIGGMVGLVMALGLAVLAAALFANPDRWRDFAPYAWIGALLGARRDRRASRSYIYLSATIAGLMAIAFGAVAISRLASAGAG